MGKEALQQLLSNQVIAERWESHKLNEPMVALCTDNKDPDKLGRVKVKLPTMNEQETSWWAPLIMPGAGKDRGWFFIPEVDDEVLIAFEHGDPNRPVVIGGIWNGVDKPPDKNPGNNPRRMIKSREGSKVTFDDELDQIVIEDGTGKGKLTFDAKNNKMIFEALEGDFCIQAPIGELKIISKETQLKAGESIIANIGTTVAVGTDQKLLLKGTSLVQLTGGQDVSFNSGGEAPQAQTPDPQEVADKYGS